MGITMSVDYVCDDCGAFESATAYDIDREKYYNITIPAPEGWELIAGRTLCPKCIEKLKEVSDVRILRT